MVMTLEEFQKSGNEPAGLTPPLRALWHDARGDWDAAHHVAQKDDSRDAAWVHAYLHRKEGDISNARYWYARAGRIAHRGSLEEEWQLIVNGLLALSGPDKAQPKAV
ncbi:MAG TPA: hypothetical protein VIS71_11945 [Terrimicrobium sp.]